MKENECAIWLEDRESKEQWCVLWKKGLNLRVVQKLSLT